MNKNLRKLTLALVVCGIFLTTTISIVHASPQCEVDITNASYDPIKAEKQLSYSIGLWILGEVTSLILPKMGKKIYGNFIQ